MRWRCPMPTRRASSARPMRPGRSSGSSRPTHKRGNSSGEGRRHDRVNARLTPDCWSSMATAGLRHCLRAAPGGLLALRATCWSPTTPPPCPPASAACTSGAGGRRGPAGRPALAGGGRRAAFHRHRLRRGRSSHPHRGPPPATAAARRAMPWRSARSAPRCCACSATRASSPSLCRDTRRDLGRHRAARPADPVRARRGAARAVGRVDQGGRAPGRVRAAVGRLRARLEAARDAVRRAASASRPLTHAAGISSTGDGRSTRGCPSTSPTDLPAATVRAIARTKARGGSVIGLGTTVTRALEHAASQGRRAAPWRRPGHAAHRRTHRAPGRGRDRERSARGGEQPLRAAAGVRDDAVLERMSAAMRARVGTGRTSSATRCCSPAAIGGPSGGGCVVSDASARTSMPAA